jgi:hypothetical protein
MKTPEQRYTDQQRKAIEVYCRLLADAFTDAGYSIQVVLEKGVERDWTQSAAKELLWKPIMAAMTDKQSTTQLDSSEVSKIYETLNRHTSNIFGIGIQFPSRDDDAQPTKAK